MLPAQGVWEALINELVMTVSACTTPLKRDIPALTVTMPAETSTWLALIVTLAEAVTLMPLADWDPPDGALVFFVLSVLAFAAALWGCSSISASHSGLQRSRSVSSIRSRNSPPASLAMSCASSAE